MPGAASRSFRPWLSGVVVTVMVLLLLLLCGVSLSVVMCRCAQVYRVRLPFAVCYRYRQKTNKEEIIPPRGHTPDEQVSFGGEQGSRDKIPRDVLSLFQTLRSFVRR